MNTMTIDVPRQPTFNRRLLLASSGAIGIGMALRRGTVAQTPAALLDELVIDLSSEPASIAPGLVYEPNGWSITNAIFDALWEYDDSGNLVMVGAESLEWPDAMTMMIKLRAGQLFHDGSPVTSGSIVASWQQVVAKETGSSIAGNFGTITAIEAIDDLTAQVTLNSPSPWLPAQIAAWMPLINPATPDAAGTSAQPNGSGPYSFVEWVSGDHIKLAANPAYSSPVKGQPIASKVTFRFVTEGSTRVADLNSGTAQLIRSVPVDSLDSVRDKGNVVVETPVSGVAFVRIATDTPPFDDVRVRQALNYAVDVDTIRTALLDDTGQRLPNLFPPGGMGFDAALPPYSFDPDKAKSLLKDAGVSGLETTIAVTNSERKDIVEAIAGYLSDIGIKTDVQVQEIATFNAEWADPKAAPLRFASWRPMFDPFNLLFLVFGQGGYLSRYSDGDVQSSIAAAASENDPKARAIAYQELGKQLTASPGAIYLWNLSSIYGAAPNLSWTPRPDDAIVPTDAA